MNLEKKTATLFELPCRLGSWLSGSSERIRAALLEFARALGLAFQLADDVLDLTAEPSNIGKPTLTDLREGIYSYPVILALRQGGAEGQLGEALRKTYLTDEELHTAAGLVQQRGAINAALSKAQDLAAQAKAALAELPALAARESLSRLANFAVCRTHRGPAGEIRCHRGRRWPRPDHRRHTFSPSAVGAFCLSTAAVSPATRVVAMGSRFPPFACWMRWASLTD